jgi:hypothetical protein
MKTEQKLGQVLRLRRVDPGVSVAQSAIIGERSASSHFKPLERNLGSAPQRHPGGLSRDQLAFGNL